MPVRSITFQIALLVIIIVGVLIIIHSSWTLSQLNRVVGDTCPCSGVTDQELNNSRILTIIMLLIGIAIVIYALIMFFLPTAERREEYRERLRYGSRSGESYRATDFPSRRRLVDESD